MFLCSEVRATSKHIDVEDGSGLLKLEEGFRRVRQKERACPLVDLSAFLKRELASVQA